MAENSGFFNAQLVEGVPDRTYEAADFAAYYSRLISNGVFANPTTNLQVVPSTSGTWVATVKKGSAYINGYWYELTEDTTVNFDFHDIPAPMARWDAIVLTLNLATREIALSVKKGSVSQSAPDPELIRNSTTYQICLAQVQVKRLGNIRASNIYDRRGNTNLCGWVASTVQHLESTELFAQFEDIFYQWFSQSKYKLDNVPAGKLQHQIDDIVSSVSRYAKVIFGGIESNRSVNYKNLYSQTEVSQVGTTYKRGIAFAGFTNNVLKESSDSGIVISVPVGGPDSSPDTTITFTNPGLYRISLEIAETLTLVTPGVGGFKICLTNSDGSEDLAEFTPISQDLLTTGEHSLSSNFAAAPWFNKEVLVHVSSAKLNIPYRLALKTEALSGYMNISGSDIPLVCLNIYCVNPAIEVQQDLVYQVRTSQSIYDNMDEHDENTLYIVYSDEGE